MDSFRKIVTIILAGGKGTRMGGDLPKVLYTINGRPMINMVIETAINSVGGDIVVVVGYKADMVKNEVSSEFSVDFAIQKAQLGTADAVKCALPSIDESFTDAVILFGDVPLISAHTISNLVQKHFDRGNDITILTAELDDPKGYGRIVTCEQGNFLKIVEEKDADQEHRQIREVNTGICCVSLDFLRNAIWRIGSNNAQKEYYFTDIIEIGNSDGRRIGRVTAHDPFETLGVNTPEHLRHLEERNATSKIFDAV